MALKLGDNIAQIVPEVSYLLWQKTEFREMIDFNSISQTEQDRIFNELEVSFLGLFHLYLENLIFQIDNKEEAEVLEGIKASLSKGFLAIMTGLGIEEEFIKQWSDLIEMRLKEYQTGFKYLMENSKNIKEFEKNEGQKVVWARIETVTIDCISHIRHGKMEEKDPLKKYLQDWLTGVDQLFAEEIKKVVFKPQATT